MQDLHENYRLFLHLEELGDLHPPKKKKILQCFEKAR